MIVATDLVLRLGGHTVLDGVSVSVKRREILGVIGPPESGKTMLLKTLAGLVQPESGELRVDGDSVLRGSPRSRSRWQRRIGMAFQRNALFDGMTVFENVAFPLRRRGEDASTIEARVARRLADVGLSDTRHKLPSELSGGMRKRVGIARATVIDPELGLFDEPIAGLDPVSAARILDLVVGLTRSLSMAVIVVSNDLPVLLPIVDRVVMLHRGRVVYDGDGARLGESSRPEVVQFATGSDDGPL